MNVGPKIYKDNLTLCYDASSSRSTLRTHQLNNILPDPGSWVPGTGGSTGYGANGSSTEQLRVLVSDDPWGRNSVVWRTTPDDISGADGGWDSNYYPVDVQYTYRYSVWIRRHTAGTGGTCYMGMNPNPIRNDNGASQGNPYFTYPSIASLTQNMFFMRVILVVDILSRDGMRMVIKFQIRVMETVGIRIQGGQTPQHLHDTGLITITQQIQHRVLNLHIQELIRWMEMNQQ
jgi:hypothetical protein